MKEKEDIKEESPAAGTSAPGVRRFMQNQDVGKRSWPEWVAELKVDKAVARGACASVSAEWDAPIDRDAFEKAVANFAKARHG